MATDRGYCNVCSKLFDNFIGVYGEIAAQKTLTRRSSDVYDIPTRGRKDNSLFFAGFTHIRWTLGHDINGLTARSQRGQISNM